MTELLDYKYFVGVVAFTLLLIYSYYRGQRENLRRIRETAAAVEKALSPLDRKYTWLGGVVGFSAEFRVEGFREVQAVLTLVPRQSLLFMPVVLLRGGEDRLQVLYFLEKGPPSEFHVVPCRGKPPHIYKRERLKVSREKLGEGDVEILYEDEPAVASGMAGALADRLPFIRQLSLTPERSVFYVEIRLKTLSSSDLEDLVRRITDLLRARPSRYVP